MKRPVISSADARPRVHIRAARDGARYRFGATGIEQQASDPVEAFRLAYEKLEGRDFVTFVEGPQHG